MVATVSFDSGLPSCFDGGGYDWGVSYDSGGSFQDVDFAAFQDIVNNSVATGIDPFGNPVVLGSQGAQVVTNDVGADAVVSVGNLGTTVPTVYANQTTSTTTDTEFDPNADYEVVFPRVQRQLVESTGTVVNNYDEYGSLISEFRAEMISETTAAVTRVRDEVIATTTAFQSGTSDQRIVGPGITRGGMSGDLDAYDVAGGPSYYDSIQNRAAAAVDNNLPAGLTNPLDFGAIRLESGTFVFPTEEDAALYGEAYLQRTLTVLGINQEQANALITSQDLLFNVVRQNPDEFLIRIPETVSGEQDYFELKTDVAIRAAVLLERPGLAESIQSQLRSGVDPSQLDLRLSALPNDGFLVREYGRIEEADVNTIPEPGAGGDLTADQRRERELDDATLLANSIWASFRAVNGLRGYEQLDGGSGGNFEPAIDGEPGYGSDTVESNLVVNAAAADLDDVVVTASRSDIDRIEALDQLIGDLDNDWNSADPTRKARAAVLAQDLIETNGFGIGLDREQLEVLDPVLAAAPGYAAYAASKVSVLSQEIYALSTDTTTYNERQAAAQDFWNSLTSEEKVLLTNTDAGRLLAEWRSDINPFAAGSNFRDTPFTPESVQGIIEYLDKSLERWGDIETPGGRTFDQLGSAELAREYPGLVYYNDAGDAFFITGKPLDQLTRGDILNFVQDLQSSSNQSTDRTIVPSGESSLVPNSNIIESSTANLAGEPIVSNGNFVVEFDANTGDFEVVNTTDGAIVARNLTKQEAEKIAEQTNEAAADAQRDSPTQQQAAEPRRFRLAAAAVPASAAVVAFSAANAFAAAEDEGVNTTAAAVSDPVTTFASNFSSIDDSGFEIVESAADQDTFTDPNLSPYGEENDPQDFSNNDAVTDDPYAEDDQNFEDDQVENPDPEDVDPNEDPQVEYRGTPYDDEGNLNPGWAINEETGEPYYKGPDYIDPSTIAAAERDRAAFFESAVGQAARNRARQQAVIEAQRKQANEGDWRVKLRLAGGSQYLYNDPGISSDGILYPLKVTDGVIFPYTPVISTVYGANYSSYDLTHSNLRGYFYQNSYVDEVNITATFTAQDTSEANYLLSVIHFFRSVTKMFYGQDGDRGQPPPLVFLQGLGEFQFNLHPCVVRSFNYNMPNDVDYIRARSVNINGTDLLARRDRQTLAGGFDFLSSIRLESAGLKPGGLVAPPAPPTLGTTQPTYVPTRMEVNLTLLPIQSREQVSQQFSLKQFANGDLIKAGFW